MTETQPYITLKFACSLDGFLDDSTPQRKIFSPPEDRSAVEALRAESDAILIGAETLRKDNPVLGIRDESLRQERVRQGKSAEPLRIVLVGRGAIPRTASFFSVGSGKRILAVGSDIASELNSLSLPAEIIECGEEKVQLPLLLEKLFSLGVRRLLVEGGSKTLEAFITSGLFDRIRVLHAAEILGAQGGAKLSVSALPPLFLEKVVRYGDALVSEYVR